MKNEPAVFWRRGKGLQSHTNPPAFEQNFPPDGSPGFMTQHHAICIRKPNRALTQFSPNHFNPAKIGSDLLLNA